jgi:ABC-type Fe3+ transport system permease subunit
MNALRNLAKFVAVVASAVCVVGVVAFVVIMATAATTFAFNSLSAPSWSDVGFGLLLLSMVLAGVAAGVSAVAYGVYDYLSGTKRV